MIFLIGLTKTETVPQHPCSSEKSDRHLVIEPRSLLLLSRVR
jgi:hypothetical protein